MRNNDWTLTAGSDIDFRTWSYGRVNDIPDLYSPKIFGPTQDRRCECGEYAGDDYVGRLCSKCGVKVTADSALMRKQRLGHVLLPFPCHHPLAERQRIDAFPIAPLGYRTTESGAPNELGLKYERLVHFIKTERDSLPDPLNAAYYPAVALRDSTPLLNLLEDIVGVEESGPSFTPNSVLALLPHAILTERNCVSSIIRSAGLSLMVLTRI